MTNDSTIIKTSNLRECHFYWKYMVNSGFKMPPMPSKAGDFCYAFNSNFGRQQWTDEELKTYIQAMKDAANAQLIPQKELEWIDHRDERLCYWIWSILRLAIHNYDVQSDGLELNYDQYNLDRPYLQLGLNQLPLTSRERYELIIEFFDTATATIEQKRGILAGLRRDWEGVYSTEKFLRPNSDEEGYGAWLWNYVTSNENYPIQHWFLPQPKKPDDMFKAAIAAFDVSGEDTSTKKLFIIQMKKAWSQKKHRMAIAKKNKKSYNFTLTTSTKALLDEMANTTGHSRNEVLERLIKLGHSKLNNKEDIW
ncbi:hypothetical protein WOB89_11185 [Vibrio parahaemolyticus]|uniref:hypothetical protein n=1 Tax=Vibrio parahaemolyticus TaxID=670 RepID=UPI000A3798FC|nr:hypothetical protein [Vibrio parahaemolyticus]OUJ36262.1 hypothetical protein BTR40_10145 [Vibrio parahaemolyticus]